MYGLEDEEPLQAAGMEEAEIDENDAWCVQPALQAVGAAEGGDGAHEGIGQGCSGTGPPRWGDHSRRRRRCLPPPPGLGRADRARWLASAAGTTAISP